MSRAATPGWPRSVRTIRSVMSPWEQGLLADSIIEELAADPEPGDVSAFGAAIDALRRDWRVVWALHGQSREGWRHLRLSC